MNSNALSQKISHIFVQVPKVPACDLQVLCFKEVEEYLQYAFEKCDRDVRENKRSILRYLISVKMLLSQMPKQSLLQKFQLAQFSGIMEAVKEGHLANLNATLEKHEKIFIKWGIFLIQEKLKMITIHTGTCLRELPWC